MDATLANKIWDNIWSGNKEEISKLIDDYEPYSDEKFAHPILHEIAHQSGKSPFREDITEQMRNRFKKQNELFRFLWLHPKFNILKNNFDYRDKYGYTALGRLRVEFEYYCDEQKKFIIENICPDIEKVELVKSDNLWQNNLPRLKFTDKYFGKLLRKNDFK